MIRRITTGAIAAALVLPWAPAAHAADEPLPELSAEEVTVSAGDKLEKGTVLDLASGPGAKTYIVQLADPAVPSADLGAGEESGYRSDLRADQARLKASIRRITGAAPKVSSTYTEALNGIAVKLTRAEALKVSELDGVVSVKKDFTRQLMTDVGPEWIGAPTIWEGTSTPSGVGNMGEGVIVGILDTGINPANPSFAAVGKDGYAHENPWGEGNYVGVCATDPTWGCNDKLIGYWDFDEAGATDGRFDDDGHGSHTGSTTAGNVVDATTYSAKGTEHEFSVTREIKGVAPHANIVGYDVCDGDGCQGTSILDAIEQAIVDEIDVINYSIGSGSASSPWADDDTLAFLNARAAGIHVATSAGNAGPGAATIGAPGDVPWMTTVGATQHNRQWQAKVTDITDGTDTLPDLSGVGFSKATAGAFPVVDAGVEFDNATCFSEYDENTGDPLWTPDVAGKIVICERGGNGRVEKGEILAFSDAAGMILVNDEASGDSLNADAHALPAVHVSYDDGVTLKEFVADHPGTEAALSGGLEHIGDDVADIMAAFSSRGPNRAVSSISPSVSAPGVDILAAAGTDNSVEWHFISGTSMASPHTAGALALLKAEHPTWSPAEAQSALMTTAVRDIADNDGTDADWFDMGSGRIDLTEAANAGLVLDETEAGYLAANPAEGGDVKALNTASMADNECLVSCGWTRTFTGTSTGVGTWTVSVENLSPGLTLSTDVASIAVTDGGTADVTVTAEVDPTADTDTWLFGTLVLTPPAGSDASVAHLPVGVLPSSGVLPDSIDILTRRDAGSQPEEGLKALPVSDLQLTPTGLVPGDRKTVSVPLDTTNRNPYDGNGVHVERITVPEGAKRLVAKLENPTAPDFDLYVGRGEVSAANEVTYSASGGSNEGVDIADPEAGEWWVLVQNWEAADDGDNVDTTDLVTAVVAGDEGNMRATGPEGPIDGNTPFDIRVFWDEPQLDAGETWYGALSVGTAPGAGEDVGVMPVTLNRIGDDVTKTADKAKAASGDVVTYTVDVAPNVAREDFEYSIRDELPEGMTYVEGSATGGATYDDGFVTWSGTLEAPSRQHEAYNVRTSAQDPSCVNPLTGVAEYIDFKSVLGRNPAAGLAGDGRTWTLGAGAFSFGLYEQMYSGLTFSDDGFLSYGSANYGGAAGVPQSLPDAALPNNIAAGLWQDMEIVYDATAGSGVTALAFTDGTVAVEFDNLRRKDGTPGEYDIQVMALDGTNDIVWAYGDMSGPLDEVTIGVENADGSGADALVNKGDASSVIAKDTVVCMTSKPKDVAGASFTYQATVDEGVTKGRVLTNKATHSVDNPGAKPDVATYSVTVKDAQERSEVALAIDPNRIQTGGTTTATATVFSAGETAPTGTVEFYNGTTKVGTGTIGAGNRATATLSGFTTAGTFPITAKYLGDASTLGSTSAPVNLVVEAQGEPQPRVGSRIEIIKPNTIRKGQRAKVKIFVTAPKVTPTGTVKVTVKGAVKSKTYTVTLDRYGKASIKLAKAKKLGKIKIRVVYSGDAAVYGSTKRAMIRVTRK